MKQTLGTSYLTFQKRVFTGARSDVLAHDDRLAKVVAGPLFGAGVFVAGITERKDYCSTCDRRPYHSVTVLLQGSMRFEFGGRTHPLFPGELACVPAGTPHVRSARHTDSWWLYYEVNDIPAWEPMRTHGPYVRPYEPAALMFLLLRDVLDARASHSPATIAHALECSRQLVDLLRNEMLATCWERSPHGPNFQQLIAAIMESPERKWKRRELAARLHLSVRRMSEVFREEIGVSPHEFLVRQRLNRAIDQLVNTDRPIKAIAAVVGYESLHAFTRLFTRHVGLPPGKYRDRFGHPMDQTTEPRA